MLENKDKVVVLFNGAPFSGKDTGAIFMKEAFGFGKICSFKDELYKDTANLFGLKYSLFRAIASDRDTKEVKTRLLPQRPVGLFGWFKYLAGMIVPALCLSPRQALIYTSEEVVKPKFGKEHYGNRLAQTIRESESRLFLVPDSGFKEELAPLIEKGFKVFVVRILRPDCTFENDSRSQFEEEYLDEMNIPHETIINDGGIIDFKGKINDLSSEKIAWLMP